MAENKKGNVPNEVAPPDWLNASLIQEALRRGGEKNFNVKQLTLEAALPPGENYGSVIYRAKATLQNAEKQSLIVKTFSPGDMEKAEQMRQVFRREIYMFRDIVPEMEAVLNSAAPGRYSPLTARGLHHGTNPEFLVLEDLGAKGFKMADRHKGLGLRHSLLALRALARFHAASVLVLERVPKVLETIPNRFADNDLFQSFMALTLELSANAFRSWPGYEEYADTLDSLKTSLVPQYIEMSAPKPGKLNVISHGDFWINNMLFRYEDEVPQEVRLLDLQLSTVTSPALDLLYFLGTSVSEYVSIHHEDLLIREYHKALCEAMELVERKPPSLEELLEDINAHGSFGLFGTMSVLPIIKSRQVLNMDAMVTGDSSKNVSLYDHPTVKRWFQRLIPEYKRKGWLSS